MATRNTILLRGDADEETAVAAPYAITPGMLVELTANGEAQPHSSAGGEAAGLFAREQHENQGAGIDDDIAADDEVTLLWPAKGAKINALTSDTIERGDFVQSAGDGQVAPFDSGTIVGVATEDSDLSGDNGRVHIRII